MCFVTLIMSLHLHFCFSCLSQSDCLGQWCGISPLARSCSQTQSSTWPYLSIRSNFCKPYCACTMACVPHLAAGLVLCAGTGPGPICHITPMALILCTRSCPCPMHKIASMAPTLCTRSGSVPCHLAFRAWKFLVTKL